MSTGITVIHPNPTSSSGSGSSGIPSYVADTHDPTGFITATTSDISFDDLTYTFTIEPKAPATEFSYYHEGVKYTKTSADTVTIDNTKEGMHVIYYDGDTLKSLSNPSGMQVSALIEGEYGAIVSYLYWDVSAAGAIYFGEERHGIQMSGETHRHLHYAYGLVYDEGLALNSILTDQAGSSITHVQFGVDAGTVRDEDIKNDIGAIGSTTGLPLFYMLGSAEEWQREFPTNAAIRTYDNTSATRLAYNEYTGGAWQLTQVPDGDFVLYHVFATTDINYPIISIMGQNYYVNTSDARVGAETEINDLVLNRVLFPELKPIGTIIFQTKTSYTNTVNARIVSTESGGSYIDWRGRATSSIGTSTVGNVAIVDKSEQYAVMATSLTSGKCVYLYTYSSTENLPNAFNVQYGTRPPSGIVTNDVSTGDKVRILQQGVYEQAALAGTVAVGRIVYCDPTNGDLTCVPSRWPVGQVLSTSGTYKIFIDMLGSIGLRRAQRNYLISDSAVMDGANPPAALATTSGLTNGEIQYRAFDGAGAAEDVIIRWRVPWNFVRDSLTVKVNGITLSANSGTASFKVAAYSSWNGEPVDGTFSTADQEVLTLGLSTSYIANDVWETNGETDVVTIDSHTEWQEELATIRITRDSADSNDTYAADLGVTDISLYWTERF